MIGLTHYLAVAAILFTLGVLGIFLNRRNINAPIGQGVEL